METTPRWLDAEERRAWLAYIDFSTLLADYLNRQLRRDAGMTHADYVLLAILSSAPERSLGMSELARQLRITRSRLTHAVNRLSEDGLVDRREDPADGRGQLAVLTDAGYALLEQVAPGHVEAVRRAVFDALTPEQVRQFAEIGEAIGDALQRVETAGADPAVLPWRRR
ncbi:MarR family transcriptional regulator [Streptomyces graminofaciens]|uniref:MarR family transcriptional regulator n=1 Tax=Streptomyces graminofaciens TaxID=68212 RepID=A0ABM7F2T6_9ACTN|nr:MarR family transcriptional regulator [Streptomyces graminofaciens]BBC30106.1 MarR family transcriptional regulator [Streptomyces graminofaciens]